MKKKEDQVEAASTLVWRALRRWRRSVDAYSLLLFR